MKIVGLKAYGAALLFIASICLLAVTPRAHFGELMGLYSVLFVIYGLFIYRGVTLSLKYIAIIALAVRLPWFFGLPLLSDDFYRFLWDGLLVVQGVNPLGIVPAALDLSVFHDSAFASHLVHMMNSPQYPSVYPPFHQAVFAAGAALTGNADGDIGIRLLAGVNGMRACILLTEALMFWYFLKRREVNKPVVAAYLLNPLVVAEGIGNVHLEAMFTPMLAIALYAFVRGKLASSGMFWAAAVATKLTPLVLAPAFLFRLSPKGLLKFGAIAALVLLTAIIWFEPWNFKITNGSGLTLYFRHFEFNASLYYVISRFSEFIIGYNPIGMLGPALGILTFLLIVFISYKKRAANLYEVGLIVYLIYFLFATTVHPWYIIPVVFLALASGRKLLLAWSFAVWLSYFHYLHPEGPPYILIFGEYMVLFAAIVFEHRIMPWLTNRYENDEETVFGNSLK